MLINREAFNPITSDLSFQPNPVFKNNLAATGQSKFKLN